MDDSQDTIPPGFDSINKSVPFKNRNRVIIAHMNMNPSQNKFDLLSEQFKENILYFCFLENKIRQFVPRAPALYFRKTETVLVAA